MTRETTTSEEDFGQDLASQYEAGEEGRIQIGPDVIARIVEIATQEVGDVVLESKRALTDLIRGGAKEGESVRGILVERHAEDSSVSITVSVRMAYGKDMYDLAVKLRRHIKAEVEKMTRVVVRRLDVRIVGVTTGERGRAAAEREEEVKD